MELFKSGEFVSHSGIVLPYKIERDALSGTMIDIFAKKIARRITFSEVYGVPRGCLRLAKPFKIPIKKRLYPSCR